MFFGVIIGFLTSAVGAAFLFTLSEIAANSRRIVSLLSETAGGPSIAVPEPVAIIEQKKPPKRKEFVNAQKEISEEAMAVLNRADRREAFLSLTPAGRTIYDDLAPGAFDFARRLFETVDPADRAAFERAVARLTEQSRILIAESKAKHEE